MTLDSIRFPTHVKMEEMIYWDRIDWIGVSDATCFAKCNSFCDLIPESYCMVLRDTLKLEKLRG